jgi:hypothetical protein
VAGFASEFVHECRSLAKPLEALFGRESMEIGVTVKVFWAACSQGFLELA